MKENKIETRYTAFFLVFLTAIFWIYDYVHNAGLISFDQNQYAQSFRTIWIKSQKIMWMVSLSMVLLAIFGTNLTSPVIRNQEKREKRKKNQIYWKLATLPFALIIVLRGIGNYYYDVYVLGAALPLFFICCARGFVNLSKTMVEDDIFKKLPKALYETPLKLVFHAKNGTIEMPSPHAGILTQGSQRSGKTASWGEPVIFQCVQKGYSAFIYDYKGSEQPMTKCAYNAYKDAEKKGVKLPDFINITFTDPLFLSHKINPISPRYLTKYAYAENISTAFFKNLNKDLIKKMDFWGQNAVNIGANTIWFLKENYPHYCTVPHFITLLMQPLPVLLQILSIDKETKYRMRPIMSAFENEAGGQLAGAESSAQLPFSKLFNKEVFWVFSGDEIDLRINDPKEPKIICVANHESMPDALTPLIGVIYEIIRILMNDNTDYHPCLLSLDELPTIFLNDLDFIPATMGSKKVITHIMYQEESQLIDLYGKDKARRIMNMGNQIYCRSNDITAAKNVSDMFGEKDVVTVSNSMSDNGNSTSESVQRRKKVTVDMVQTQPVGHACGKMMETEPQLFYTQMNDGRIHKLLNIEENQLINLPQFGLKNIPHFENENQKNKEILDVLIKANFNKIIDDIENLVEELTITQENPNE